MAQMRKLLLANISDRFVKLAVTAHQESKLIVKMAVDGGLDRGGARPDAVTDHEWSDEAEDRAPGAPQRDQAARPGVASRHRGGEHRAVPNLVLQHVAQIRHDVGKEPARDRYLRPIDTDGAIFPCMV